MVQRLHTDKGLNGITLTPMFCREIILRLRNMSVFHQTTMFIRPRTFPLIFYEYYSAPARLFARAPKPKFSDVALRLVASKPPVKMWVVN